MRTTIITTAVNALIAFVPMGQISTAKAEESLRIPEVTRVRKGGIK